MGIFDLFSGRSGRLAAMATAQQLAQTQAQTNALLQQGKDEGIGYVNAAEPQALAALGTGYDSAREDLGAGYNNAVDAYGQAGAMYNPYAETGLKGFNLYADAAGINGPEGNANAVGAFQASPGYQWAVNQATDSVARKASSLGTLGGGNTMAAISDRAGHMADQEYGNWLQRLQGIGQTGYNATGAQANLMRGQGDLATGYGQDMAKSAYGYGSDVSSTLTGDAARKAGIVGNTTALGANALSELGKLNAQNTNSAMLAGQAANKNALDAILKGAEIVGKIAGAKMGASA